MQKRYKWIIGLLFVVLILGSFYFFGKKNTPEYGGASFVFQQDREGVSIGHLYETAR